jgi:hypothetical protein
LWVIFALLDPDPDSEYGSGSTGPIEYGSNPDPEPWKQEIETRTWIWLELPAVMLEMVQAASYKTNNYLVTVNLMYINSGRARYAYQI